MSVSQAIENDKAFEEQMRADITFFKQKEASWLQMSRDCRRQWKKIERQLKKSLEKEMKKK